MDDPGRSKKDSKKVPDLPKEEKPPEAPTVLRKPASTPKVEKPSEAPTVVREKPSVPKEGVSEESPTKREFHSVPREPKREGEPPEKKPPPKDPRVFNPDVHEFPKSPEIPKVLEYKLDVIISYLHRIRKAIPIGFGCGLIVILCLLVTIIVLIIPIPGVPFIPATATPTATPTWTLTPTSTLTPTPTPISISEIAPTNTPTSETELAPTETATATSTSPPSPEKQILTFVGQFFGGWKHLEEESLLQWAIKVYGGDPEPIANAEVTVRLDNPDTGSERMTVTTDADGMATGEFTIYSYGTYTLTIEEISGANLEYTPEINAYNSISVNVESGENPLPASLEETILEFISLLSASVRVQEADFLFERLHPQVFELYGEDTCRSYLASLGDPTFTIQVESISGPDTWTWEREDQAMQIPNVYSIRAYLTSQGETAPSEIHFALMDDGTHRWFTDCDG